jgi:hypothetical protein
MNCHIDERNVLFWCHFEWIDLAFMEGLKGTILPLDVK